MAGRPSKYKPESVEEFLKSDDDPAKVYLEALSSGEHSHRSAAAAAGISEQTVSNWCSEHPEFLEAKKKAEGLAVCVLIGNRQSASGKNNQWQRYAWMLERMFGYKLNREEDPQSSPVEIYASEVDDKLKQQGDAP